MVDGSGIPTEVAVIDVTAYFDWFSADHAVSLQPLVEDLTACYCEIQEVLGNNFLRIIHKLNVCFHEVQNTFCITQTIHSLAVIVVYSALSCMAIKE